MYKNRVKISLAEISARHRSVKYMITNRVVGGSYIFGDQEKKHFLNLLIKGQGRHGYRLLDYVLMDNHYHCLVEVPPPEEMSRKDLVERQNRANDLDKACCFMLKVRFATKGIVLGAEEFVEHILSTCGKVLGYKRKHHSHDYHVWDNIHTLKKHRKVYC